MNNLKRKAKKYNSHADSRAIDRSLGRVLRMQIEDKKIKKKIRIPRSIVKKFLIALVCLSSVACIYSYFVVIEKEQQFSKLSQQLKELNLENIELEAKLNKSTSFSKQEENILKKASFLQKPKEIIRIN